MAKIAGPTELVVGGAQTLSKQRTCFPGAYPRSLVYGSGATVWERFPWEHGSRPYTDFVAGLGAISLGYQYGAVDLAVREQVGHGPIFSLSNVKLEERVAQRLVDLIPCAESVRFFKTGSEATEAAIRGARAHTGRDVIICPSSSYHGWHSWYAVTRPEHPGVPEAMTRLARVFPYNDLPALDVLAQKLNDDWRYASMRCNRHYDGDRSVPRPDVAAIILEPTLIEPPAPGFLEGLRERCDRWGAILIFDEGPSE